MAFITKELIDLINTSPIKQYRQAQAAGYNPTYFSKIKNQAVPVNPNDPRIEELGRMHGIPKSRCTTPEPKK